MGLLNGGIAAVFGAAFGALYLPATLYGGDGPTYDDEGNVTGSDATKWSCRAQIDAVDWSMKSEGYIDGDVRVIIIAAGLPGPVTADHQIVVEAPQYAKDGDYRRWSLSSLNLDTAGSHWVGRGRAV